MGPGDERFQASPFLDPRHQPALEQAGEGALAQDEMVEYLKIHPLGGLDDGARHASVLGTQGRITQEVAMRGQDLRRIGAPRVRIPARWHRGGQQKGGRRSSPSSFLILLCLVYLSVAESNLSWGLWPSCPF